MIKAARKPKEGYILYYEIEEDGFVQGGGLNAGLMIIRETDVYNELLFRALINLIMGSPFERVFTKNDWGFELESFGFIEENGVFTALTTDLKLPRFCGQGNI